MYPEATITSGQVNQRNNLQPVPEILDIRGTDAQDSGAWNHEEYLPEYPHACTLDARRALKN